MKKELLKKAPLPSFSFLKDFTTKKVEHNIDYTKSDCERKV
jgi:hypothetical protein